MSRFERVLNKIILPNIYVRVGGALTGGGLGYTFSKVSIVGSKLKPTYI